MDIPLESIEENLKMLKSCICDNSKNDDELKAMLLSMIISDDEAAALLTNKTNEQ